LFSTQVLEGLPEENGTKKEIWEIKIIFKKPESGQIKQFIINVRHRTDSKTLYH
jgi:hypothetical protein